MTRGAEENPERVRFEAVFGGLWPAGGDSGVDGWLRITDRRVVFRPRGVSATIGALVGGLAVALLVLAPAAWLVPALAEHLELAMAVAAVVFVVAYRWLGRRLAANPGTDLPLDAVTRVEPAPPPFSTIALDVATADGRHYLLRAVNLTALRHALEPL